MTKKTFFHEFQLPEHCTCIEFLSDMHLHEQDRATFNAWQQYMQQTQADALFILGDLFESWVGDDILQAPSPLGDFERECAAVIATVAEKSLVYFIHGNRDFLVGEDFSQATKMTLLPDPVLLLWDQQRTILTHGDLLCIDDVKYQEYRQMIHMPQWQQKALKMPLELRIETARQMRAQSEKIKQNNAVDIMDVNMTEVVDWFHAAQANLMIHGHTHRPADHTLLGGEKRIVLTDWNVSSSTTRPRAEALRWKVGQSEQSIQRISLLA